MPAPEAACRLQTAVLWSKIGDDDYGEPLRDDPEEINVRWVQRRTASLDANGNTISLDATVVVNQEIVVGSLLWLGALSSWTGTGSAGDDTELMIVATYNETPDLKNREIRRMVGLRRFRDSLPDAG